MRTMSGTPETGFRGFGNSSPETSRDPVPAASTIARSTLRRSSIGFASVEKVGLAAASPLTRFSGRGQTLSRPGDFLRPRALFERGADVARKKQVLQKHHGHAAPVSLRGTACARTAE
jgi:hypothetical protein